jgi:hypothetical protein
MAGPPPGTTHVLQHLPSFLVDPPQEGWGLQAIGDYLASTPADHVPFLCGPADMDETAYFAEQSLGYLVALTPFEVEFSVDGQQFAAPAFYVGPR